MELNETQLNAISLLIGGGGDNQVTTRIKARVKELKDDFNALLAEELQGSSFSYDVMTYDSIGNSDLDQTLFSQIKESLLDYGGFDFDEFENAINEIKDISREYYSVRREIRNLEHLLE